MPRVSPIQEAFNSGALSKRVRGRVSSEAYKNGLKEAKNWYPLVQGPIRMREGSSYLTAVDSSNWVADQVGSSGIRDFTFQRGIDEDVVIEVGNGNVIVRNSTTGEQLSGGVTGNLIPDPEYSNGFPSAQWDPDRDKYIFNTDPGRDAFDLGGPFLAGTPDAFIKLQAQTDDSPDGFHGPAHENAASVPIIIPAGSETLLNELIIRWRTIFSSEQITALGGLPFDDPVIRVSVGTAKGAADVFTSDIVIGQNSTWVDTTFNFTPGMGNNDLYLSVGLAWTGTTNPVPDLSDPPSNEKHLTLDLGVFSWTAPLAGGSGTAVEFASPWTQQQLECLQFDMDPGEQVAFFTHPEVEPYRLRLATGEWTFEALTTITTPNAFAAPTPNNWAAGNWPGACVFHEGRLWLGGSPNNPATLWGSRSGNYVDFNNSAPASKDDPVLFPLASSGNIQTLTSRQVLVINTDISEVIGFASQGPIAFDDFSFPKQSDWGSNCVKPIEIGNDMLYTSPSRKIIRTLADQSSTNIKWDGTELSLLAQDLFSSPVRQMAFVDEPTYQAAFLLADGTLAMATYFYPENVIGWWKYETAYNGSPDQPTNQVMAITIINTSQGAKLWMTVNRVGFTGTDLPGHEVVGFDQGLKVALDSHSVRNISPIDGTCDDLDHLTGQTVQVVVERFDAIEETFSYTVHPDVLITAGSTPALDDWAWGETAHIGHQYDNQFQLLSVEGVSNRGTSQSSKRRWNRVTLRLNDSAIPLVDGQRAKDRTPSSLMGEGEPFTDSDVEFVDLGSGEGDLIVTQDKPLISEVVAIFGKVASREV